MLKSTMDICYTSATSVVRYYHSELMNSPWTADSIHFMVKSVVSLQRPSDKVPLVNDGCDLEYLAHRYPFVPLLRALLDSRNLPTVWLLRYFTLS